VNRFESLVDLSVEVEIDVADILYISFGPAERAVLYGIHSQEHVVATGALTREPGLKIGTCDGLCLGDGLNRVTGRAIAGEDRGVILRPEQFPDILRCRQRARREFAIGAHGWSCFARNTAP